MTQPWNNYSASLKSTCPKGLLDKKVLVRFRNGVETSDPRTAQLFTWEDDGRPGNIVAYRIVEARS